MNAGLRARGLALRARLDPTDLELAAGSLTALIGPNGAGKTSLLHAIAGVGRPAGDVFVGGRPLGEVTRAARAAMLGYVPASRELAWPIAVRAFVALTARQASVGAMEAMLDALDLASLAERPVDTLSTGERTRVLLARALLPEPEVLLLDEPFANLDPLWQLRLAALLRAKAGAGMTILFSAHDLDLAGGLAERVLIVDRGRVVASGRFDDLHEEIENVFGVRRGEDVAWEAVA